MIADLDVGVVRQMGQLQLIDQAGAQGDGTQAIPVHLYRQRVACVGDQDHGCGEGIDLGDLGTVQSCCRD